VHFDDFFYLLPKINDNTNTINATKNTIFAAQAAWPATPVNPKNPAAIAMTKNKIAHPNITLSF
jgi:hypothetical protein